MIKNHLYFLIGFIIISSSARSDTLRLDYFLKKAQEQSPDISIERSIQEIANTKANGIKLPNPMIGLMTMTESGSQQKGFEINQEIPFPSKIKAESNSRTHEAEAQLKNSNLRLKELISSAKNSFLTYWLSFKKKEILQEKKEWIKDHLKLAKAVAKADNSSQLHLLEIEAEFDTIEAESLSAESDLNEKKLLLKVFTPNLNLESITPELPDIETSQVLTEEDNNYVLVKKAELNSLVSEYNYKKQAYFPDLVFRFKSYEASAMKAKNEELMIGVTLPFVFFWQANNESHEASVKVQKAHDELQKTKIESEIKISSILQRISSLKKQLQVYKEKLLPRAHKRMKLVENLSVRNIEGLNEHRNVMLNYLDLKMKEFELRADYETLISELEKFIPKESRL